MQAIAERAVLDGVREFVSDFNADGRSRDIYIEFQYPVYVSTSVAVRLLGPDDVMDDSAEQFFLQAFNTGFGAVMLAGGSEGIAADGIGTIVGGDGIENSRGNTTSLPFVSMELLESKILMQFYGTDEDGDDDSVSGEEGEKDGQDGNRRSLAEETTGTAQAQQQQQQSADEEVYVSLFVRASCGTPRCTPDYLRQFLVREGNEWSPTFTLALRSGGPASFPPTRYFDTLETVVFGPKLIDDGQLPTVPPEYKPRELPANTFPYWVWIVVGVDVVILLVAAGWSVHYVRHRRPKLLGVKAQKPPDDDDHSLLMQFDNDGAYEPSETENVYYDGQQPQPQSPVNGNIPRDGTAAAAVAAAAVASRSSSRSRRERRSTGRSSRKSNGEVLREWDKNSDDGGHGDYDNEPEHTEYFSSHEPDQYPLSPNDPSGGEIIRVWDDEDGIPITRPSDGSSAYSSGPSR